MYILSWQWYSQAKSDLLTGVISCWVTAATLNMLIVLVGGPYSSMALSKTHSKGSRWIFTGNRIRVILTEDLGTSTP